MKSLKKISMFQNGIRENGMKALLKVLPLNPDLEVKYILNKFEVIKINDNLIKTSAKEMVIALPSLKNLKSLDVSDSLLGNEGSLNIFKALKVNFIFYKY